MRRVLSLFYNNPDTYPPVINGTRLLAQAGFGIDLVCRADGQQWEIAYPPTAHLERVGQATSGPRGYGLFMLAALQRGRRATIIAAHDLAALLPAVVLARVLRRPLVYHVHDYLDRAAAVTPQLRLQWAFQQRFARTAQVVTIPDAELGQVMARELELPRPPLVVANAPLARFKADRGALRSTLRAAGYTFDKVLLRQGRIGPGHAIESTLESMIHWAQPDWGFVLMGIGQPIYVEQIRARARRLGLAERVAVLPPVAYDRVGCFTVGADLGNALYEPISVNHRHIAGSNKIREYMAAGIPLVAANRPALRAFVQRYDCGLVADEHSPESIAQAVNAILSDEPRAQRMGQAAARAFERELSYEHQFAPALRAYCELSRHGVAR